jgi:transposase
MSQSYPSDITYKQFNKIKPILESVRKKTRPRIIDLYDIFCGVLYVLKSGCQWRMLPKDFPKWELCYYYFSLWNNKDENNPESILEIVLKKISWRGQTKQWSDRENQFYNN